MSTITGHGARHATGTSVAKHQITSESAAPPTVLDTGGGTAAVTSPMPRAHTAVKRASAGTPDASDHTDREITLPAVPMAISVARQFTRMLFTGTARAGDAALIASELTMRSIWHGADSFAIRIIRYTAWGRIEVTDPTTGTWTMSESWPMPELGLSVVLAIADRMGHACHPGEGQMLWAEITWN